MLRNHGGAIVVVEKDLCNEGHDLADNIKLQSSIVTKSKEAT